MVIERVMMVNQNFNDFLMDTIKEIFQRHFPKERARLMFEYIILETLIQKDNVEVIGEALRKILGANYIPLSFLILKRMYFRLNIEFEEKDHFEFIDYLNEVKNMYEQVD